MGVSKKLLSQNGWFRMKNPIKMDDVEVPLFFSNIHTTRPACFFPGGNVASEGEGVGQVELLEVTLSC